MKAVKSILVVDDDREDHIILMDYFSDAGLQENVVFVENGQRALDYLEATEQVALPKLIILDLNMPILNGTQTLLKIKQNVLHKHIPVIIYSTSENETEKRKCLSLGAIDYLVKPMTFDEGVEMIRIFSAYLTGGKK
jgi:CheY-like chemotaxis protein